MPLEDAQTEVGPQGNRHQSVTSIVSSRFWSTNNAAPIHPSRELAGPQSDAPLRALDASMRSAQETVSLISRSIAGSASAS